MEATFLAKRALFNIPKFLSITSRVSRASLSTAYERAEGSNAVAEGSLEAPRGPGKDGTYEVKHEPFATGEGQPTENATGLAADAAKDGVKKGVETAENVRDTAKKTLDGAWSAAKDTAQGIKESVTTNGGDGDDEIEEDRAVDEIKKVDQPVDTQEYRSIEELRTKAGGYDKA